jgi:hypothetical protein
VHSHDVADGTDHGHRYPQDRPAPESLTDRRCGRAP